jgi:PAS domain S-box-containing protein
MAGSDLLIGLSYLCISIALLYLVRRMRLPFRAMVLAFGLFIAACGFGHFVDIATIWYPVYWLSAIVRVTTALASVVTALALIRLIPEAMEQHLLSRQARSVREGFQLLVQNVKEYGILTLDADGKVVTWNDGVTRIYGYDSSDILGKHYSLFYTSEDIAEGLPEENLKETISRGQFEGEGWRLRKDGSRFYSSFVLTALMDENGKLRGFAKVLRDVTERRKSEVRLRLAYEQLESRIAERTEELRRSNAQLQVTQDAYLELVNTVDGIVWEAVVGKPGFTFVSRQAERISGYPLERWQSESGFWQSVLKPEDRERLIGERYLAPSERKDSQVEYRMLTADGRTLWIKDYMKVIYESGVPTKMRGIMVDITARKQAEEKLKRAQDSAIKAANVKSIFLANMSHEIRTPLNAIIGMSTLALDLDLPQEPREYLTTIKTAADSLLVLVGEILDFSKIEAGKLELEFSDFNLATIAQNAVDVVAPLAQAKSITLKINGLESKRLTTEVAGDPGRLMQVLMNLLSNAVKFTPENGLIELNVTPISRVGPEFARVRFEVKDTGPGISPEVIGRLFQPFCQADGSTARKYGGTGLGLSICKRLVDLMSGKVGVESQMGKGATFWFEMPFSAPVELPQAAPPPVESGKNEALRARVLVAEDNLGNQKVIRRFLEKLGHECEVVSDGHESVSAVQSARFDLVLMDCQMPEMDGYEAARKIRDFEKQSGREPVPIVALTANALSGDDLRCRTAGMDAYLCKPVTLNQLGQVIRRWVRRRKELESIDHKFLDSLEVLQIKGEPDIVRELIDCFDKTGKDKISSIDIGIADGNLDQVHRAAHHLKSTCHNVGARKLADLCSQLEAASERGEETDALLELFAKLREEHDKVAPLYKKIATDRAVVRAGAAS